MIPSYEYIRRDLTAASVQARAVAASISFPTFDAADEAVRCAASERDWVELAAVGRHIQATWPTRFRGYLAQFDGLRGCGLHRDALDVISLGIRALGPVAPLLDRKIKALITLGRWDLAAKSISGDGFSNESCVQNAFSSAIFLKDFTLAATILKKTRDRAEEQNHARVERLRQLEAKWLEEKAIWDLHATGKTVLAIEEAKALGNHTLAETGIWALYVAGSREPDFFQTATIALAHEPGHHTRVLFFRHLAYERYPVNAEYVAKLAKSLMHRGLVDDAYMILSTSLRSTLEEPELYMLRRRAERVVSGSTPSPISAPLQQFGRPLNAVEKLEHVSAFNEAMWRGNTNLAAVLKPLLLELEDRSIERYLNIASYQAPKARVTKPSVALCVSGQMRSFPKSFARLIRDIGNPLEADVFVHTWDTHPIAPPQFRELERFLGSELAGHLPGHLRHATPFRVAFPKTTQTLLMSSSNRLTEEEILSIAPRAKVVLEGDADFVERHKVSLGLRPKGSPNQAKMFYKIYACDHLARSSGLEYDVVIRTRPDLRISFPYLQSFVADVISNPYRIYVPSTHADGFNDMFAIGSSAAMQAYSAVWKYLREFQRFDYLPGFKNEAAEQLLGQHLIACGLEVRVLPVADLGLESIVVAEHVDLTGALAHDAESGRDPQIEAFRQSYLQWRSAAG